MTDTAPAPTPTPMEITPEAAALGHDINEASPSDHAQDDCTEEAINGNA